MASPIATAYVAMRPDFTGFSQAVAAQSAAALRSVQVPGQLNLFPGGAAPIAAVGNAAAQTGQQIQRSAAQTKALGNSYLATKQQALNLQAGLIGLGQGATSSRLAFFGWQGVLVSFAAAAGFAAVRAADDLQVSLNTLAVVAGASQDELREVGKVARQLGADITLPSVSAADAGDAMTNLARAGLSVRDAMDGARGVLQLAAAAQTDNATAAVVTARALNAFSLAGSEATRVADLLTGASIAGGASIEEMAVALQQAAAAAAQINVTINDTTDALALLAKNGLAGSDAGTSLRTALLRLNPQAKEAKDLVEALGIEVFNQQGQFIGLPAAIEEYRRALQGLTDEQRQAALATIFGQDAFRAISILTREGAAGFERIARSAERQGIAAELAAARTSGLRGQFNALASNAETLGVNLGSLVTGPLTELVGGLNDIVGAANRAAEALISLGEIEIPEIKIPGLDLAIPGTGLGIGEAVKEAADVAVPQFRRIFNESLPVIGPIIQLKTQVEDLGRKFGLFEQDATESTAVLRSFHQAVLPLRQALLGFSNTILQTEGGFFPQATEADVRTQIERLGKILEEGGVAIGDDFVKNLEAKLANLSPQQALDAIKGMIVEAVAAGRDVGEALGLGIADGVREAQVEAVKAAQATLGQIIEEGQQAVRDSVVQAKQSLLSIGQGIAQDFAQIIDFGPLGRQIATLEGQLNRLRASSQGGQLNRGLRDARRELQEARESLVGAPSNTDAEKKSIERFLEPFKENVKDAQDAVKEFNTEGILERLRTTAQKQKDVVTQGINDIIARFNAGQLSLNQTNTQLANLLGNTANRDLFKGAGNDLGFSFRRGFREQLEALKEQIAAIVASPVQLPGTGQKPSVTSPAATFAREAQRADAARLELQRRQKELQDLTLTEARNQVRVLKQILDRFPKIPASVGTPRGSGERSSDSARRGAQTSAEVGSG